MDTPQPVRIRSRTRPDAVGEIRVSGDLDVDTAPALLAALEAALDSTCRLVVDLAEVPFLDSSGINALLRANLQATGAGGWLRLARVQPAPERVIRLVGMDVVVPLYDSADQAVADQAPPGGADRRTA